MWVRSRILIISIGSQILRRIVLAPIAFLFWRKLNWKYNSQQSLDNLPHLMRCLPSELLTYLFSKNDPNESFSASNASSIRPEVFSIIPLSFDDRTVFVLFSGVTIAVALSTCPNVEGFGNNMWRARDMEMITRWAKLTCFIVEGYNLVRNIIFIIWHNYFLGKMSLDML